MNLLKIQIDGIIFSIQNYGGITVYFRELLSHLATKEISVNLSLELPPLQDLSALSSRLNTNARAARAIERFRTCRVRPDISVFHSSYYRQPACRDIPTVVTVHDFIYERFRGGPAKWAHVLQKHSAIRQAQAIICISESTRDDLLNFVGVRANQTVHVIPNGVSPNFKQTLVESPPTPFFLFVGERRGYKNFSLALAGLALLPDLEMHCVGGGPLRADELKACSPSVRKRVRHLGFVTDDVLNIAYNQAVCLVYPSRYEGFGIPVAEAMKAGCPVVSVDCKAVIEVAGGALERLDEEDPYALASAVRRLCEPAYREQRIAAGLKRAQIYDWSFCHEQTLAVYRSLSLNYS